MATTNDFVIETEGLRKSFAGQVAVDGVDLRDLSLDALRQQIALMAPADPDAPAAPAAEPPVPATPPAPPAPPAPEEDGGRQ